MVTGFSLADQSGTDPLGHSYRENAAPWMNITLAPGPTVLMSDPRVAAIPVADCGEPLIDVRGTCWSTIAEPTRPARTGPCRPTSCPPPG